MKILELSLHTYSKRQASSQGPLLNAYRILKNKKEYKSKQYLTQYSKKSFVDYDIIKEQKKKVNYISSGVCVTLSLNF